MEVSEPKFELRNAVNALTNARTLLHSFQVKPVEAALADGEKVAAEVQSKADHALEEYTYRQGLAGRLAGAHLDRHRHAAALHPHAARRRAVTARSDASADVTLTGENAVYAVATARPYAEWWHAGPTSH